MGRVVSHSSQQPRKCDSSPSGGYDKWGREQCQQPPTEATRGCAPLTPNLTPTNPAHNHEPNTSSTLVDKVHNSCGDLTGPQLSKGRPRGKMKRVPVAPSGGGEKSNKYDSPVKLSSVPASSATPERVGSGASQRQAHLRGKSCRINSHPRPATNESLQNRNNAMKNLGVDTRFGAGDCGRGTDVDNVDNTGAGTGKGNKKNNNGRTESCRESHSEVNADRAEKHPAPHGTSSKLPRYLSAFLNHAGSIIGYRTVVPYSAPCATLVSASCGVFFVGAIN